MGKTTALVLVAALAVTVLTGCATPTNDEGDAGMPEANSSLTLEAAKSLTIERRDEIASFFPGENTGTVTATEASKSLMPCRTEDSFGWPGRTTIVLAGDVDQAAALEPIATEWEGRDGWTVERGTTKAGVPELVLDHEDGTHVNVSYYQSGSELWVDAVSPCFDLPGGYTYGTEY
ncbi:MAG: hypothetical protein ABWY54_00245 [Glaciihabitans sp.]